MLFALFGFFTQQLSVQMRIQLLNNVFGTNRKKTTRTKSIYIISEHRPFAIISHKLWQFRFYACNHNKKKYIQYAQNSVNLINIVLMIIKNTINLYRPRYSLINCNKLSKIRVWLKIKPTKYDCFQFTAILGFCVFRRIKQKLKPNCLR